MIPSRALSLIRDRVAYIVSSNARTTGVPFLPPQSLEAMIDQLVEEHGLVKAYARTMLIGMAANVSLDVVGDAG